MRRSEAEKKKNETDLLAGAHTHTHTESIEVPLLSKCHFNYAKNFPNDRSSDWHAFEHHFYWFFFPSN